MESKRTPIYEEHVALGGKMVDFCGYALPVQYSGIIEEHLAVRNAAGVFDVSHMGRILIEGPNAAAFVQRITTNDISEMKQGQVKYSFICNENGGIMDDVLIYARAKDRFLMVVNAVNTQKILAHMEKNAVAGAKVEDITEQTAQIALQGPKSVEIAQKLCEAEELPEKYYTFQEDVVFCGVTCMVSRTGYTGEDGFEIYCPAEDGGRIFSTLLKSVQQEGILPCGLGCRDTLRFEAGMPLYGHELSEEVTPFEAGLGVFVRPLQGTFIGKDALDAHVAGGVSRKRIGLKMIGKGIARQGYHVYVSGGVPCGVVTSGSMCPSLGGNYAMALINVAYLDDAEFTVEIRGKQVAAEKVALPFYKRQK